MTSPLYAVERGTGAKAMVFLHGFGGSHAVWADTVASLPDSWRTVIYDLPGHGRSLDFPGAGAAKLASRSILADLSLRGIEKAHVVGHSMGGAIAALMALADPRRIASLTLLAPGGFGEEINGPLMRRYGAAVDEGEILACLAAMSVPAHQVSRRTIASELEMRGRPGQMAKLVEIAEIITRNDRQGVIPRELLATLTMPIAVMWGTADPVLPFAQTRNLPPHFELHVIAGAGHMLVSEVPDAVSALIRDK